MVSIALIPLRGATKPKVRDWQPATIVKIEDSSIYPGQTAGHVTDRIYTFDLQFHKILAWQNLTPIPIGRLAIPRSSATLHTGSSITVAIEKTGFYVIDDVGKEYKFQILDWSVKSPPTATGAPAASVHRSDLMERALRGEAEAQFLIGSAYLTGKRGFPMDYLTAAMWLKQSATKGHPGAQCNLGTMYQWGHGLQVNMAEAERLYRLAAQQGLGQAQNNLAWFYWQGKGGLPVDFVSAYMWFNLAASQNVKDAASDRDKVATSMSSEQILEAQRLSLEWMQKNNHTPTTR